MLSLVSVLARIPKKLTRFEENYVKDWSKDEFNVILDT